MELSCITKILGGQKVLRKKIQNRFDLIELSNMGITKNALSHLAKYLCFSMSQMAELLPVTERTIQRYASNEHFNRVISEQILKIAEVATKGAEIFDDKDKFLLWMNHPHTALVNRTPMSLLKLRIWDRNGSG